MRTGTESHKWRSPVGYQWREQRIGERVQGIRSINARYKIDSRRLRIIWELICTTHVHQLRVWGGRLVGGWVQGRGGERGEKEMGQL